MQVVLEGSPGFNCPGLIIGSTGKSKGIWGA
jgi:hypothetical protein